RVPSSRPSARRNARWRRSSPLSPQAGRGVLEQVMKAIIVGGGIGGLVTALMLHERGIACEVYEQADAVRELGVGINTLPHAIAELKRLGLLERLGANAVRTGCRLGSFRQDEGSVTAWFFDRTGAHVATDRGDVLIGAD